MNGETGLHDGMALRDASTVGLDVPDRMSFCQFWTTDDQVNAEVYIDPQRGDGRILLVSTDDRTTAEITDANGRFDIAWSGDLGRPATWLNAQRIRAAHLYTKSQP